MSNTVLASGSTEEKTKWCVEGLLKAVEASVKKDMKLNKGQDSDTLNEACMIVILTVLDVLHEKRGSVAVDDVLTKLANILDLTDTLDDGTDCESSCKH